MADSFLENLARVRERIERACDVARRDPAGVRLIAVSKTHPVEAIQRAYDAGLRDFGESRLQEAEPKIEALPTDIVWHFIGHLQSNKARRAASKFSVIHTLSSDGQIREIEKGSQRREGFIEVNIADEPQKAGISLGEVDDFQKKLLHSQQIHFCGLMTIGPATEDPEQMRPYFRALREANQRYGGQWLSMGMSHDFEIAIQEGSTHIRVGSALFGAR